MNKTKPIIGILPDFQIGAINNAYSRYNHYAIRQNYVDAINNNGGTAILLTYNYQAIDQYLELIDGLLIVGGNMDIHPNRYNESIIHDKTKLNLDRENFEFAFVGKALQNKNLPILGICNGMQLLAIIYGDSKVIQHIPDNPQFIDHEQSNFAEFPDYKPYHPIDIEPTSQLAKIIGATNHTVNSSHHQAITQVCSALTISARAKDGIIEAIEDNNLNFCLGVQWHPEFSKNENNLFTAFIKAATQKSTK